MHEHALHLIRTFKKHVHVGVRSKAEYLHYIGEWVDLQPIALEKISPSYLLAMKHNAVHALANVQDNLDPQFDAYKVNRNQKSECYYSHQYGAQGVVPVLTDEEDAADPSIIVLIEKDIPFAVSNDGRLMMDLQIAWGVSKQDYESNTPRLMAVLSWMDIRQEFRERAQENQLEAWTEDQ